MVQSISEIAKDVPNNMKNVRLSVYILTMALPRVGLHGWVKLIENRKRGP